MILCELIIQSIIFCVFCCERTLVDTRFVIPVTRVSNGVYDTKLFLERHFLDRWGRGHQGNSNVLQLISTENHLRNVRKRLYV